MIETDLWFEKHVLKFLGTHLGAIKFLTCRKEMHLILIIFVSRMYCSRFWVLGVKSAVIKSSTTLKFCINSEIFHCHFKGKCMTLELQELQIQHTDSWEWILSFFTSLLWPTLLWEPEGLGSGGDFYGRNLHWSWFKTMTVSDCIDLF